MFTRPNAITWPTNYFLIMMTLFCGILAMIYKDTTMMTLLVTILTLMLIAKIKIPNLQIILPDREIDISKKNFLMPLIIFFVSLAAAILVNTGYNWIKYRTMLPQAYLEEAKATQPSLLKSVEFFIGIIFSPNGGLLAFWLFPLTIILIGTKCLGFRINRFAFTFGFFYALVSAGAFALWWAPFGWDFWGNRLMVAPMLTFLIVLILTAQYQPPKNNVFSIKQIVKGKRFTLAIALIGATIYSAYYVLLPHLQIEQLYCTNHYMKQAPIAAISLTLCKNKIFQLPSGKPKPITAVRVNGCSMCQVHDQPKPNSLANS
ncbi:MAG: hypothetical protein NZM26_02790 [Patescibacteria group bacterium]|nr:hypothetical protein [Patescibacteria group bacterium]